MRSFDQKGSGTGAEEPMRNTEFAVVALLLVWLCAACAASPQIDFDERGGFERYASWDWLPGRARTVDAPTSDSIQLIARNVGTSLQGFVGFKDVE